MSLCVHGVQIRLPGLGKVGPVGHHVARQLSLLLSVPTATSMQIFFQFHTNIFTARLSTYLQAGHVAGPRTRRRSRPRA